MVLFELWCPEVELVLWRHIPSLIWLRECVVFSAQLSASASRIMPLQEAVVEIEFYSRPLPPKKKLLFLWHKEIYEIPQTPNRIGTTVMRMFDSGGSNQLQWRVLLHSWMIPCQAWLTKGLNGLLVMVGRFWASLAPILLDSRQASQNSFIGSVFAQDEISRRNRLVLVMVFWGGVERIRPGQLCLFLDRWHGSPNHISKRQNHRGVFIRSIWIRFNCMLLWRPWVDIWIPDESRGLLSSCCLFRIELLLGLLAAIPLSRALSRAQGAPKAAAQVGSL